MDISGSGQLPAGWYLHAGHPGLECFWDGQSWTGHMRALTPSAMSVERSPTTAGQVSIAKPTTGTESSGYRAPMIPKASEVRRLERKVWIWAGVSLVGGALSVGSFLAAQPGQRYWVLIGPVVVGAIQAGRYLDDRNRLVNSTKEEVSGSASGTAGGSAPKPQVPPLTTKERKRLEAVEPASYYGPHWAPDPLRVGRERRCSGRAWTEQVRDAGSGR